MAWPFSQGHSPGREKPLLKPIYSGLAVYNSSLGKGDAGDRKGGTYSCHAPGSRGVGLVAFSPFCEEKVRF